MTIALALFFGCLSYVIHNKCIDFSALEQYSPGLSTILLDDQGNEWTRFSLDRRRSIYIEQMPKHLTQAFLAAEDWYFYDHMGLSIKGIIRSILVNLYHAKAVQGASTITQQLVRLLFFNHKKTFTRKIKEQLVALLVELQFSKDQILETYLNHVYFGCGIYGVEAAAQRFWAKHACQVTLDEAAILAAIIRSPGTYCPLLHPSATQQRRNVVLSKMLKLGFISSEQYQEATCAQIDIIPQQTKTYGLHARETIRQFLEQLVGKDALYTGGFVVQTTVNKEIQQKAETAFVSHIKELRKTINSAIDGALLTMTVNSGEIKALIGGVDYAFSRFNRALQAKRQLGSVFKPLIFAAALQQGKSFADIEYDEPLSIKDRYGRLWEPQNHDLLYNGPVTLAYALSRSNNIVTIKTFLHVGADCVIDLAKKCYLSGPFHHYPSLSLGCINSTLDEALGTFNLFVNNGVYVKPHLIKWIKDRWGTKIYKHKAIHELVIPSHISGQVLKVLGIGLQRVRDLMPQKWIDSEAASKTGTTNDSRTCWFIGSTPELTTGIYIGCDDNRSMGKNIYPLRTAFPIWLGLHRELKTTKKQFSYDPSLQEIIIDEKTGKICSEKKSKQAISILV